MLKCIIINSIQTQIPRRISINNAVGEKHAFRKLPIIKKQLSRAS